MVGLERVFISNIKFGSVERLADLLRVNELEEAASTIWSTPDFWGPDQQRTGHMLQRSVLELEKGRLLELGLGKNQAAKLLSLFEKAGVLPLLSTWSLVLGFFPHTRMV